MAERARSLRKNLSKSKAANKPISNQLPSSTVQEVDRPIPGKLGPPELSKEKKNQMMERMISARQNLQKNGLS